MYLLLCGLGIKESKTLMVCGFNGQDSILIRSRKVMDYHWEETIVRKKKRRVILEDCGCHIFSVKI